MTGKQQNHSVKVTTESALNRRKLLQIGAVTCGLGILWYYGFAPRDTIRAVKHSQPLMGTIVNMTVCGPDEQKCREVIAACITRMDSLSSMMSTYNPQSPISQLNRDGILQNSPGELVEVFRLSRQMSEVTDGAFDPTVMPLVTLYKTIKKTGTLPSESKIKESLRLVNFRHIVVEDNNTIRYLLPGTQATLDGIAKGYIVDQGVKVLREHGFNDAYIEAGGDLMTIGTRQDGNGWKIGIRNPRSNDLKKMDTIVLSNRAIATSGDYLQYFTEDKKVHHIINPFTGFSPVNTASSSILAPNVATADGLATATMVLGPQAAQELVESLPDCEGYFFDKELNKYQTTGFFS